jgi:antitoxin (DNA-binding transcriptional repressor) of toxin-antitoxin stability system
LPRDLHIGGLVISLIRIKQVTLEQATESLGDLMDAAADGEDIVVVRDAKSAIRLVPVPPPAGQRIFGSARGLIQISDDFDTPLDDFREYQE